MSDYIRKRAVFYPITNKDIKKLDVNDIWDLEDDPRFKDLFERWHPTKNKDFFEVEVCVDYSGDYESHYYLTYVLYYAYGGECGDFGINRLLKPTEQDKYEEIFRQILPEVDKTKFKYVDFCYYNCSEPDDYYLKQNPLEEEI